jgi:hypothetical protein
MVRACEGSSLGEGVAGSGAFDLPDRPTVIGGIWVLPIAKPRDGVAPGAEEGHEPALGVIGVLPSPAPSVGEGGEEAVGVGVLQPRPLRGCDLPDEPFGGVGDLYLPPGAVLHPDQLPGCLGKNTPFRNVVRGF